MSYVWAAYGVTFAAFALYGVHLARERRRLVRSDAEQNGG